MQRDARILTVAAGAVFLSACGELNLANAFNDLDLADTEISANITFNIANGTRMDCADPTTDGQPATAPCFTRRCVRPAS